MQRPNRGIILLNLGMEKPDPPATSRITNLTGIADRVLRRPYCRAFVGATFEERTRPCFHTTRSIPNQVISDPDVFLVLGSLRLHL